MTDEPLALLDKKDVVWNVPVLLRIRVAGFQSHTAVDPVAFASVHALVVLRHGLRVATGAQVFHFSVLNVPLLLLWLCAWSVTG